MNKTTKLALAFATFAALATTASAAEPKWRHGYDGPRQGMMDGRRGDMRGGQRGHGLELAHHAPPGDGVCLAGHHIAGGDDELVAAHAARHRGRCAQVAHARPSGSAGRASRRAGVRR